MPIAPKRQGAAENLTTGNLGISRNLQFLSVRVAARHRPVNTRIAKPTPADC